MVYSVTSNFTSGEIHLDIRQLNYFIAVAEYLNFTEAANHLYVAQSAVSQQIADLEEKMGVKLFHRSKRSVQLTPAGKVFLNDVIKIVKNYEAALEKARQTQSGFIGSVSVGFLNPHVKHFLPAFIKRFREQVPGVELQLNHLPSRMLKDSLESDEVDIAITLPSGLHKIPGIQMINLLSEPYKIVLHASHPLAMRTSLHLQELANEPFIIHNRYDSPVGSFDFIVQMCEDCGFTPRIVYQPRFIDTVLLLVEAEMGVAILPQCMEAYANDSLKFVDLKGVENNRIDLIAAWKRTNTNPTVPIFLEALKAFLL
jgi:DNA-binding transcriptional LysR family regulator